MGVATQYFVAVSKLIGKMLFINQIIQSWAPGWQKTKHIDENDNHYV